MRGHDRSHAGLGEMPDSEGAEFRGRFSRICAGLGYPGARRAPPPVRVCFLLCTSVKIWGCHGAQDGGSVVGHIPYKCVALGVCMSEYTVCMCVCI